MTAMVTILRKGVHKDELALHARAISALAEISPGIFPAGSDIDKPNLCQQFGLIEQNLCCYGQVC